MDGVTYEGNDRYEGYSIDLIEEISKILGFKYVFELVPDNAYGSYDKNTKKWNGLVKQLLEHVSGYRLIRYFWAHSMEQQVIFNRFDA